MTSPQPRPRALARRMVIPQLAGLSVRLTDGTWVNFVDAPPPPPADEPAPARPSPGPRPSVPAAVEAEVPAS